jgi:hypothetical protein
MLEKTRSDNDLGVISGRAGIPAGQRHAHSIVFAGLGSASRRRPVGAPERGLRWRIERRLAPIFQDPEDIFGLDDFCAQL